MDASHLHLLLNHFPIIGTLIATMILLWGIFKKNHAVKMLSAALLVAMALIAIPVYLSGEPAEEQIEHIPDFVESLVESHEDAALIALIIMELTGVAAFVAFVIGLRKGLAANSGFLLVVVLSIVTCISMARVGYLGGKIRHTELRDPIQMINQVYELQGNESDSTEDEHQTK